MNIQHYILVHFKIICLLHLTALFYDFVDFIFIAERSDPKKWIWNDGSPMSYKDWDEGEPSTNGQCGYIRKEHDSHWDDEPCDHKKGFLCKIMKSMPF